MRRGFLDLRLEKWLLARNYIHAHPAGYAFFTPRLRKPRTPPSTGQDALLERSPMLGPSWKVRERPTKKSPHSQSRVFSSADSTLLPRLPFRVDDSKCRRYCGVSDTILLDHHRWIRKSRRAHEEDPRQNFSRERRASQLRIAAWRERPRTFCLEA